MSKLTQKQLDVLSYLSEQGHTSVETKPIFIYKELEALGLIYDFRAANGLFWRVSDSGNDYLKSATVKLTFTQHDALKHVLVAKHVGKGTKPVGAYTKLQELGLIELVQYGTVPYYKMTEKGSNYLTNYRS